MKLHIRIATIALNVAVLVGACDRAGKSADDRTQWINSEKIEPGPIRRENLTDDQMKRVRQLQRTFREVDSSPIEKWVDDFKRDVDPEKELRIWESMATAFEAFTGTRNSTIEMKREVFQVVLMRSGSAEDDVLKRLKLKILTKEDAREIMAHFSTDPTPITVIQK